MREHVASWSGDTLVASHCWWHLALFHLARGDVDGALLLYDQRVRADRSAAIADLIDASALLWRMRLQGAKAGTRWAELADAWSAHIEDGFCSFSDVHAMLAFVGAGDRVQARRLERALAARQWLPTRHGQSTRRVGLPACRALMAFDRGDDATAVRLLAELSPLSRGLGGSHAQRDVLHLTLLRGIEHLRRPGRQPHGRQLSRASSSADRDKSSIQSHPAGRASHILDPVATCAAAGAAGHVMVPQAWVVPAAASVPARASAMQGMDQEMISERRGRPTLRCLRSTHRTAA